MGHKGPVLGATVVFETIPEGHAQESMDARLPSELFKGFLFSLRIHI